MDRQLDHYYPIVYIDAIHLKIRRETVATEAFYVLTGLKEDHTGEVLGIINIPQESACGWQEVLEGIRSRGVQQVGLFVFDGLTGLDRVVGKVFANSMKQNCVLHFQRNLNKLIRKAHREAFRKELKTVFNPDDVFYTPQQGVDSLKEVLSKWSNTNLGFKCRIRFRGSFWFQSRR